MKFLVLALVVFAATSVLGQTGYEYADDDLFQRVAQIVFQYDQKVAASRSGGSSGSSSSQMNSYPQQQPMPVRRADTGNYQRQERVARVSNFNNNNAQANVNYKPQPNYGAHQQQQQGFRSQRQYNYAQPQQQVVQPRVQAQPYVAAAPRTYQQPQVFHQQQQQQQGKSGFSAYTLSQPEVVQRVAEFHFSEGGKNQGGFDSVGVSNGENNKFHLA